jgi:hypothetical protein
LTERALLATSAAIFRVVAHDRAAAAARLESRRAASALAHRATRAEGALLAAAPAVRATRFEVDAIAVAVRLPRRARSSSAPHARRSVVGSVALVPARARPASNGNRRREHPQENRKSSRHEAPPRAHDGTPRASPRQAGGVRRLYRVSGLPPL